MSRSISVLVPARDEETTLPITLPTVLAAASRLSGPVEVIVIAPTASSVHTRPPLRDPILRWIPTDRPGKFEALRLGADAADGDALVLLDADVIVDREAVARLFHALAAQDVDVVAGRIDILPQARTRTHRLLERWSSVSMSGWDTMRTAHPEFRWALPGAIYAIKRELLPSTLLVPLVDDASIGMQIKEAGAIFAYAPEAFVRTPTPSSYRDWLRQKLRSRRGWAELAQLWPAEVAALERTLREYLRIAGAHESTSLLMHIQDRLCRAAAHAWARLRPASSGDWVPRRPDDFQNPHAACTSATAVSPSREGAPPS